MNKENEKYRLLIENMMDGYAYHQIIKDSSDIPVDYIFLDVNSAFETITGLTKDEILGKTATEVLPGIEESGFDWIGAFGQVALTGNPIRFDNHMEPLDRWYEVSVYSGEYGFFVTFFRDITDEKTAHDTFVVSETRYRRLFESAKDGILILDAETGKIMNVNPLNITDVDRLPPEAEAEKKKYRSQGVCSLLSIPLMKNGNVFGYLGLDAVREKKVWTENLIAPLTVAAEEILSHHEHWDGSGYPQGLKGKEIPLLARITAIADAYEVMSTGRAYKKTMVESEVVDELKRCAGSQFDPELIEIFLPLLEKETTTNQS